MRIWFGAALLVLIIPALFLLLLCPTHPVTFVGWVIWTFCGIPLYLLGEFLGEKIFSDRIGSKIEPDQKKISAKRVFYGIIVVVIVVGMVFFLLENIPNGVHEFIKKNLSNEW